MIIMLSPQPCIEIAQISHGTLAASVRRPYGYRTVTDPPVFLEICVPNVYNYSF